MKGYYLKYGIFSEQLEKIVVDLEAELKIILIKENAYELDDELYFLKPHSHNFITNFSIVKSLQKYYLSSSEILSLRYLISCNVTKEMDEDIKEKFVQHLRINLNEKKYLKELSFDIDEW